MSRRSRYSPDDLFPMHELSGETRRAILVFVAEHVDQDLADQLESYIPGREVAWLIQVLRLSSDSAELFPKGKWATIQRMEALFHEHCMILHEDDL